MQRPTRSLLRLRRIACGAAVALLATPALRAEDGAALMARAPAMPLAAPVTPLGAPVEVATVGWGPFQRLCVHRTMQRTDDTGTPTPGAPFCLAVENAREEAGTWHLSMRVEPRGGGPMLRFATTRDAQGQVGPAVITPHEGIPPPSPAQLAQLQEVLRTAVAANGMARATIAADAPFILPLGLEGVAPDLRVEGGGFACRAEGETRLQDRRAIVARCTGRAAGRMMGPAEITIDLAGRFAIDVATGMVLRHGYASFLVMTPPTGGQAPVELRGTSRQTLE